MKHPVIEVQEAEVCRGKRLVLDVKRLRVDRGELVAIVGANGAGKSTLLQMINLHIDYQKGELRLFGQDVRGLDPLHFRRRCSMVFQETLLLNRSVFDNVALALRFRGANPAEVVQKVEDALATFHCAHVAQRQAKGLSGGEAQRVCLARALVYQPELLLLDEPFAALDATTRAALLADLRRVAVEKNMTVLFVSHNFDDVLRFATRAVVLQEGQVVQDDKPEVILRRPANGSVAVLVGMDNVLPCCVERVGHHSHLRVGKDLCIPWLAKDATSDPTICCLPGDALYLNPREEGVGPESKLLLIGVIQHVVPGIGMYVLTVEAQQLKLTVCVTREQVNEGLIAGRTIELGVRVNDVHAL